MDNFDFIFFLVVVPLVAAFGFWAYRQGSKNAKNYHDACVRILKLSPLAQKEKMIVPQLKLKHYDVPATHLYQEMPLAVNKGARTISKNYHQDTLRVRLAVRCPSHLVLYSRAKQGLINAYGFSRTATQELLPADIADYFDWVGPNLQWNKEYLSNPQVIEALQSLLDLNVFSLTWDEAGLTVIKDLEPAMEDHANFLPKLLAVQHQLAKAICQVSASDGINYEQIEHKKKKLIGLTWFAVLVHLGLGSALFFHTNWMDGGDSMAALAPFVGLIWGGIFAWLVKGWFKSILANWSDARGLVHGCWFGFALSAAFFGSAFFTGLLWPLLS